MEMLKKLFSSSIRADVLALLLNNPEERFYVREIAKLLRKNPSGVKRELDNLEKMGIVIGEKVANLKYFKADRNSSLYPELKKLVTKSLGLPGALKSVLRSAGAKVAFIYGPYAEGQQVTSVDIFSIDANDSLKAGLKEVEDDFKVKISSVAMSEADYNAKRKSEDAALRQVLEGKRIVLLGRL